MCYIYGSAIMLIILSDLHLAEAGSNALRNIRFDNNLPASVYRVYFDEIADFIHENHINKVDLVLAGDIFEVTRSALWLEMGYALMCTSMKSLKAAPWKRALLLSLRLSLRKSG